MRHEFGSPTGLARPGAPASARFGPGFHDEQTAAAGRWASAHSALEFDASTATRFLAFWLLSEFRDLSQELVVEVAGRRTAIALPYGWAQVSVEVPAGAARLTLEASKLLPAAHHPRDPRDLAVRVRGISIHDDRAQHDQVVSRHGNLTANTREILSGQAVLRSTPPSLGIDMHGVCNIKPPCVYCEWDSSKQLEGEFVDTPFTVETLREWGPFFDHSTNLVNCSIGEPFMMKNIDELLDAFAGGGKNLEMTTNGQILTDTNIGKLLGRPIDLYVSFDAASADTYARLRNQRFDLMVNNVRRLIDAKGGPGHRPVVNVVFMPMKANVEELDAFVDLCADLRVDHLVLRPLNYADKVGLNWDRNGYRFEYEQELLPFEQLVRTSGRAAELCRRAGIALSDQMDFGGALGTEFAQWYQEGRRSVGVSAVVPAASEQQAAPSDVEPVSAPASASEAPARPALGADRTPACVEPWKSLYILRRGVFPCCYGGRALAPMDQYRDMWNAPVLQEIRHDLAHGRFHRYCLESPACPIVRKAGASHTLPKLHTLRVRARRTADTLSRPWRRVVWARQWAGIRLHRIVTEPGYATGQVQRLWRRVAGR